MPVASGQPQGYKLPLWGIPTGTLFIRCSKGWSIAGPEQKHFDLPEPLADGEGLLACLLGQLHLPPATAEVKETEPAGHSDGVEGIVDAWQRLKVLTSDVVMFLTRTAGAAHGLLLGSMTPASANFAFVQLSLAHTVPRAVGNAGCGPPAGRSSRAVVAKDHNTQGKLHQDFTQYTPTPNRRNTCWH